LNKDLAKYLLPKGILDYFEIVADTIENDRVHFYLEEKNILPEEFQSEKSQSKGFSLEITVEDFPLRGKPVLLHINAGAGHFLLLGKL
jgi:hypothetical protein